MNDEKSRLWWPNDCDEDVVAETSAGACIAEMLHRGDCAIGDTVTLTWTDKIGSTLIEALGSEDFKVIEGDGIIDKADWFTNVDDGEGFHSVAELIEVYRDAEDAPDGTAIKLDIEQYVSGTRQYRIDSKEEIHAITPAVPNTAQGELLAAVA